MKAFALIVAAILLPFAAIGSLTAASLLRMRDGAAAGSMPTLLTVIGGALIVVLAICIMNLHKMHLAKRAAPPDTGD
jgi:uncharacterized membrane protein YbhN (UPF0104 family)